MSRNNSMASCDSSASIPEQQTGDTAYIITPAVQVGQQHHKLIQGADSWQTSFAACLRCSCTAWCFSALARRALSSARRSSSSFTAAAAALLLFSAHIIQLRMTRVQDHMVYHLHTALEGAVNANNSRQNTMLVTASSVSAHTCQL